MRDSWKLFASEYCECGDGPTAAVRAGFSPRRAAAVAARLLTEPEVAALIARREEAASKAGAGEEPVNVDWVVREAKRTYDAAHEAGSLSTAVSCLNLIGKHLEPKTAEEVDSGAETLIVTGIEGAPGSHADD